MSAEYDAAVAAARVNVMAIINDNRGWPYYDDGRALQIALNCIAHSPVSGPVPDPVIYAHVTTDAERGAADEMARCVAWLSNSDAVYLPKHVIKAISVGLDINTRPFGWGTPFWLAS